MQAQVPERRRHGGDAAGTGSGSAPARPLRVALDYRPALYAAAGITRSVVGLTRGLAGLEDSGIDLRLFAHAFLARRADWIAPPAGTRMYRQRIPSRLLPWLARIGIGAETLSGGADVFHWLDYVHPPVARDRVGVVLTVHDLLFAETTAFHGDAATGLRERTERAIARADVVAVPSEATAAAVRAQCPDADAVRQDRLAVVAWGCDHAPLDDAPAPLPAGIPSDRPFLLVVGTIEPRKNHAMLVDAWLAIPERQRMPLVVVGRRGWECDDTVRLLERTAADTAKTPAPLVWAREADDRELAACYAHCKALAYPSRAEGFGFPPLEAMRNGKPVLVGDHPAARELVGTRASDHPTDDRSGDGPGPGEAAWRLDPDDVGAWTAAIVRIDDDEEVRGRLVRAGEARWQEYRWAECARRYAELYHIAAAAARARGRSR